jgi:hypothetical protein
MNWVKTLIKNFIIDIGVTKMTWYTIVSNDPSDTALPMLKL